MLRAFAAVVRSTRAASWIACAMLAPGALIAQNDCVDVSPPPAIECTGQDGVGVLFPEGLASFADDVLRYEPDFSGGNVPSLPNQITSRTIGPPDQVATGDGFVSLGSGGLIELLLQDNTLSNSGDLAPDLHIFEIGPDVEATDIEVRPTAATVPLLAGFPDPNGDGFYPAGRVEGETSAIDLDTAFPGFGAGELVFDAIQLIDDPNQGNTGGDSVGADIDAIGAILSGPPTIPFCDVVLSASSYAIGESVTATNVRVENPTGAPAAIELKLWRDEPNGQEVGLFQRGADGSWVIPVGGTLDFGPRVLFTIDATFDLGDYEVNCRLLNPTTGAEIGFDRNLFVVE